jgi:hypothetical protein
VCELLRRGRPLVAGVQLPRLVYQWLVGDEARKTGAITLMDVGVLYGVLAAFANDDPGLFVDGSFQGEGDERTLVTPGGIGSELRTHGQTAGSPLDQSGSGHVRLRPALAVLTLNE